MISSGDLKSDFSPLKKARDTISAAHPTMAPVGRTALEVALVQALLESYFTGLKDGVMVAFSQDSKDGEPYDGPLQNPTTDPGESPRPHGEGAIFERQG